MGTPPPSNVELWTCWEWLTMHFVDLRADQGHVHWWYTLQSRSRACTLTGTPYKVDHEDVQWLVHLAKQTKSMYSDWYTLQSRSRACTITGTPRKAYQEHVRWLVHLAKQIGSMYPHWYTLQSNQSQFAWFCHSRLGKYFTISQTYSSVLAGCIIQYTFGVTSRLFLLYGMLSPYTCFFADHVQ